MWIFQTNPSEKKINRVGFEVIRWPFIDISIVYFKN